MPTDFSSPRTPVKADRRGRADRRAGASARRGGPARPKTARPRTARPRTVRSRTARPKTGRRVSAALILTVVVGLAAFGWPLFTTPGSTMSPVQAPLVFALVIPLALAVVMTELADQQLDAKALAMLGVLAAVITVLRPLSAGTAGFELVFFPLILAGRVFGAGFGFALGVVGLFTSAVVTGGVGPWLPYQMMAAGFTGLFAGWLPRATARRELALLGAYGFVSAFAYGWLMDFSFWPFSLGSHTQLSFDPAASAGQNLHRFVLFNVATSMGWNLGRALTDAVIIALLGRPLLRLLRRTARRAAFAGAVHDQPSRAA